MKSLKYILLITLIFFFTTKSIAQCESICNCYNSQNYTGSCKKTFSFGEIEECFFENGKGIITRYYKNGNKKREFFCNNGRIYIVNKYDSSGYITMNEERNDQTYITIIKIYFPNSDKLQSIEKLIHTQNRFFNEMYNFEGKTIYRYNKDIAKGCDTTKEWYNNGNIKRFLITTNSCDDSEKFNLYELKEYYDDGNIKLIRRKNGECTSAYIDSVYDKKGHLIELFDSHFKKNQSLQSFYFDNGNLMKILMFNNDKYNNYRQGKCSEFYYNGLTKIEGNYEKGNKEGIWKEYYIDGNLKTEGLYVSDQKEGIWRIFDSINKNKIDTIFYEYGKEISNSSEKEVAEKNIYNSNGIRLSYDSKNKLYGLKYKAGNIILPHEYSMIYFYVEDFNHAYVTVKNINGVNYYGLVNNHGKVLLKCEWDEIEYNTQLQFTLVNKNTNNIPSYFSNFEINKGTYLYNVITEIFDSVAFDHITIKPISPNNYDNINFINKENIPSFYNTLRRTYSYNLSRTSTTRYYPIWIYPTMPINFCFKIILTPIVFPFMNIISGLALSSYSYDEYWKDVNLIDYEKYEKCTRRGKWYELNGNRKLILLKKGKVKC